jgi:hypothetical protein
MNRIEVLLPDRHIVMKDGQGQQVLIDSGSPITVGRIPLTFKFGSKVCQPTLVLPEFLERGDGLVGVRLDALVGNDVLEKESVFV